MRIQRLPRTFAARLRSEGGYTLVELLTVMILLAIVLGALVTSFTIGIRQEVDQTRREGAYAIARGALQKMRLDIHCASGGFDSVQQNTYGGFTLTLTENNDSSSTGWCPGVIPPGSGSSGVQWCTIPDSTSPTQFRLYRFLGLNPTDCDGGTGSTFEAVFIAAPPNGWPSNSLTTVTPTSWAGNIWPTPPPCTSGLLPQVGILIDVALDPVNYPEQHYQLRDAIAFRNAVRCT